jgi:hypothetical protein
MSFITKKAFNKQNDGLFGGQMKQRSLIMTVFGILLLIQSMSAQTWTYSKRLTWTFEESSHPEVAVDSINRIHVVWEDYAPGDYAIYYKRSADGGISWSKSKRFTWHSENSAHPVIAVDSSDTLHVLWSDYSKYNWEIYYKRSADGGASWSSTKRLTWGPGDSSYPDIAVDSSDNIHIVWNEGAHGNPEIYYKKSTNGGLAWSKSKRITWTSGESMFPSIETHSSNSVHVIWQDDTPGNNDVYYRRSQDGGTTWGKTKRLSWDSHCSENPDITVDSNLRIHVVWEKLKPGNYEILYKKSLDGGTTWMSTQRSTWSPGNSESPRILTDLSNNIHMFWSDNSNGNYDIYYKRSTNAGSSWATQRLTWNADISFSSAAAIGPSNKLYLVWHDLTPGNWEIYFKKEK